MEYGEIFGIIGLTCLLLAPVVYVLRALLRVLLRPIGCLALFAGPALIVAGLESEPKIVPMVWAGSVCLLLCLIGSVKRKGGKRTKKTSKPTVKYRTIEAFVAAIESGDATIDANIRAIFTDVADQLQSIADDIDDEAMAEKLYNKSKLVSRIAAAKVNGSKEPLIHDLDDLAMLVDERRVKIDPSTKMALREVYNLVDSIELPDNDSGDIDDTTLLAVTLEQILYPVGVR